MERKPRQFWILDSRYWNPVSLSVELGFRILIVIGIPDSLSSQVCSGFQSLGFRNPQEKLPGFQFAQTRISRFQSPLHRASKKSH